MGSGGSSGLKGKTVLTGTFLAESTHSSSTSYTLVSQRTASDPHARACLGNSTGNRGDRLRKANAQRGGTQCTKLAALDDFESLLLPNEVAPVRPCPKAASLVLPFPRASGISRKVPLAVTKTDPVADGCISQNAGASILPEYGRDASTGRADVQQRAAAERSGRHNPGIASGYPDGSGYVQLSAFPSRENALEPGMPVVRKPEPLKGSPGQLQKECTKPLKGRPPIPSPAISPSRRPHSRPSSQEVRSSTAGKSLASKRLYIAKKPWESEASDSQLLHYLAERSGSPEIASLRRSTDNSETPQSHRRQHRNHRELFNDCLFRGVPPLPTTQDECRLQEGEQRSTKLNHSVLGSVSRSVYSHGQGGSLLDQIEEITIIPQDAVSALFEADSDFGPCFGDRRSSVGCREEVSS